MPLFRDRDHAGQILAGQVLGLRSKLEEPVILGIARGGIPVGYPIARALGSPLDVLVLRKLPLPQNDQMGFGAVTLDRKVILNPDVVQRFSIRKEEINRIADAVYDEVRRRNELYREGRGFPSVAHRSVIITDDGLATGYTVLAAVRSIREKEPKEIIVAVPVAALNAYRLVERETDGMVCIHVSTAFSFAVASFYETFPDLRDSEVIEILGQSKEEFSRDRSPLPSGLGW
jgi:putative phosphoribosyl transferase